MPANDIQARRDALKAAHPRYRHWEVFLTVEDDLKNISRYVDICEDNYKTYSIELASLIIRSCTEIEKLAKRISGAKSRSVFKDFMIPIQAMYPEFAIFATHFPLWSLSFTPWETLQTKDPVPQWWTQYNTIKHDKTQAQQAGNLETVLNAVAGLYAVTLYYERMISTEYQKQKFNLGPLIFPEYILPDRRFIIPGIEIYSGGKMLSWDLGKLIESHTTDNA